jgi:hypothetical protein
MQSINGPGIYPLLTEAGFKNVKVDPQVVYVDSSKPKMVDGFIKKTIIAMVEGVKDQAIESGLIDLKHGKRVLMICTSQQNHPGRSSIIFSREWLLNKELLEF